MNDKQSVLVIGCHGMLGSDLMATLGQDARLHVIGVDIPAIDITDSALTAQVIQRMAPAVVVNTAALTDVEACELHPAQAHRVNALGAYHVALACRQQRIKLIHISTDYVFDGEAKQPYQAAAAPGPLNAYGWSKLAGELSVQAAAPDATIVRTAWLYGAHGKNFVHKLLDLAHHQDDFRVVDDQVGCPTHTRDLCHAIHALIFDGRPGIYHATGAGECSWYEFACAIFALAGLDPVRVQPIRTSELNLRAKRPAYSALDCSKLAQDTGVIMPPWMQSLRDYLQAYQVAQLVPPEPSAVA